MPTQSFDYSTLNLTALRALPALTLAPTYHLDRDMGNGCAGDPPGFPTYFTRSIYTSHGNTPSKGAEMAITIPGEGSRVVAHSDDWKGPGVIWDDVHAKRQARLLRLWSPLPLSHPRVEAWIASKYAHHAHCYVDAERPEYGRPGTLIYPVPSYNLKPMLKQEYRAGIPLHHDAYLEAENFARMTFNVEEESRASSIATPDNHQAVRSIRAFYPDHAPRLDWISGASPVPRVGNWWERHSAPFTSASCPGQYRQAHPVNGSWCQMCGLDADPTPTPTETKSVEVSA